MAHKLYHQHLIVKSGYITAPKKEEVTKEFFTNLVAAIGMNVATPAQASYVTQEGNVGMTGSIGLVTSHAAYHVFEDIGVLHFDLYSCNCFDIQIVIESLRHHFGELPNLEVYLLEREEMKFERIV